MLNKIHLNKKPHTIKYQVKHKILQEFFDYMEGKRKILV